MSKNFPAHRDGQTVAVTNASQTFDLTQTGTLPAAVVKNSPDIMVDNRGAADCYVKAGDANVVATSSSLRVPAGVAVIYDKGQYGYLAIIGANATTVVLHLGEGS